MFKWLKNRIVKSGSTIGSIRQYIRGGDAIWTERQYADMAYKGYMMNIVAYRCIEAISNACADIPIIITVNGNEIDEDTTDRTANRIADLIFRPNPTQNYKTFMKYAIAYRLIGGNTYIAQTKNALGDRALELNLMRPDRVTISTTNGYTPFQYVYTVGGEVFYYTIDPYTRISNEVLQIKTFNPLNDLYGMSPLSAAMMSVDQHNEAGNWNKNLLQNSSRPSGIITMKSQGDNAPTLDQEELVALNQKFTDKFSGSNNAGSIPIFNYDMSWQSLSFSPNDMDWLNGKASSARDICNAFGFPPQLLGMPEGSTYNNVAEAKLSWYEDTNIPLLNTMLCELAHWLTVTQGVDVQIDLDMDQIPALAPRREAQRNNARLDVAAGIITINEAREAMDYEEVPGGDEIFVPAGKLPINFDTTGLSQEKFQDWLVTEIGYTRDQAEMYTKLCYTKGK